MRTQATVSLLLLLACLWGLPVQAWESKQDNKAPDDLERMMDWELCQETYEVCSRAALQGSEVVMEGLEYLAIIRRAVQQNPGEELPPWFTEASTAIAEHEQQHCPAASCARLKGERRERRSSTSDGEPTAKEQPPAPPSEGR